LKLQWEPIGPYWQIKITSLVAVDRSKNIRQHRTSSSAIAEFHSLNMSSTEESPAQRAARLRRERREAKIREGGAARLDKITSLSGRTPQSGTNI
jgi:hypothetical protein